jgi:hypothetical protein
MEDVSILDMDDPFERESFTTIYLLILQHVVDEYVAILNKHRVRRINQHVPIRYFQKFEWF